MKIKKWFWGLFFILAGGLFIANALELGPTSVNIVSLATVILLAAIIVGSIIHFNWFGILVPLAIGGALFAEQLNITEITPWPLIITAVLVSIGLEIIFGSATKNKFVNLHFLDGTGEDISEECDEETKYQVSFGSAIKYVNSSNFRKGHFSCKFGALSVYFDNAKLHQDGAEIILDVAFSGVELFIPREWNVNISSNVMLGGIEESRRRENKTGPTVTIKGNVSLAGVEINYI